MKKERFDFQSLIRLYRFSRRFLPAVVLCILLAISTTLLSIYAPQIISLLTDTLLDGILNGLRLQVILDICIRLGVVYLALFLLEYVYNTLCDVISQKTAFHLRSRLNAKLTGLPLRFFDSIQRGEVLSRATNDIDAVSDALAKNISAVFGSAVLFVGVGWKMLSVNIPMTLIAVGFSLISSVCMLLSTLISQKYFIRAQKDLGALVGRTEEVFQNHMLVRIFFARQEEQKRFEAINRKLYGSHWKASAISTSLKPLIAIFNGLSNTLVLIVGCSFLLRPEPTLTYGELTAFLIYISMYTSPLTTLAGNMTELQKTSAAAQRIFQLFDIQEEEEETEKPDAFETVQGEIVFDHVFFSYTKEQPVIQDFDLTVHPGETVAIVGPSGVGKTTLVNLLMRFYDVTDGDIRIDGHSIRSFKRQAVRSLFDMVLQDTWLFNGTIRDNLTLGNDSITLQQLDEVCETVGIAHLIRTLPDGYETELNALAGISEGQRQQLTIARMMLKNAPFLILDEATSALDADTEMQIQSALRQHMKNKTCFVIAHRLSTIRNADRIIVMREGHILQCGSHQELIAVDGMYRNMYLLQRQGRWETDN